MDFYIGQRVCDKNDKNTIGTIKYIGPVAISKNKEEIYLGVEWDNEGRGKYDGSVIDENGNRIVYFNCKENMCSFLKPKMIYTGRCLLDALKERYSQNLPEEMGGVVNDMYVETERGEYVDIKFVGGKKIMKYQDLSNIVVASTPNECVNMAGDENELIKNAKSVERLDLHNNLFSKWIELFKIGNAIPKLKFLQIDYNYMLPIENSDIISGSFNHLTDLILSYTNTKWNDIIKLSTHLPNLTDIYLVGNHITDLGYFYIIFLENCLKMYFKI